jgi:hypothetical protein
MAKNEFVCPKHGPYPANLGACPVCARSGSRPGAPTPLGDEDDVSTDPGVGSRKSGGMGGGYADNEDDMPTDIPSRRDGKAKGRILDSDDEETNFNTHDRSDETEIDIKTTEVEIIFWLKEGNRRGKIFKIKDQDVIGSRNCEVLLDDPKVSKLHAKITCEEKQYFIWDLGSRNGVYVNGDRIRAATALKENDLVRLGDAIFVVKLLV